MGKSWQANSFVYPLQPMLRAAHSDFGAIPKFNFHWGGNGPRFTAEYLAGHVLGRPKVLKLAPKITDELSDLSGFMQGFQLVSTGTIPDFRASGIDFCSGPSCFPELGEAQWIISDITRVTSPGSDKRLLLLSDSYGAKIARWFPEYYGSVWHFNINNLKKLSDETRNHFLDFVLTQYAPDDVILLVHYGAVVDLWSKAALFSVRSP
jgi:hypothetical protein